MQFSFGGLLCSRALCAESDETGHVDTATQRGKTRVPGTTRKLKNKFRNLNIVFNPEFLTERSAKFDFINPARIILGGKNKDTNRVALDRKSVV